MRCESPFFLMFLKMHTSSHKQAKVGHSGSIEYACDRGNCGKSFENSYGLQNHLNMHDNCLYRCHFCAWTGVSSTLHLIVTHYNSHFKIRPYQCSFCDAKFYKTTTRTQHERNIHENFKRLFKCGSCDFASVSATLYYKHIKTCEKRKS